MRVAEFPVATGLWPVESKSTLSERQLTEPWLQELRFPICAASSKQSGGTIGKILSTRLDGINDIAMSPPKLQQSSQKVSGDISRSAAPILHRRDARSNAAMLMISKLQGANLWSRCDK